MDNILDKLAETLEQRRHADPDSSYVASLNAAGLNKILEKVGEESVEMILAAKDQQASGSISVSTTELVNETADLWFHTMVMLSHLGISHTDVLNELDRRFGTSGLAEKAARS